MPSNYELDAAATALNRSLARAVAVERRPFINEVFDRAETPAIEDAIAAALTAVAPSEGALPNDLRNYAETLSDEDIRAWFLSAAIICRLATNNGPASIAF